MLNLPRSVVVRTPLPALFIVLAASLLWAGCDTSVAPSSSAPTDLTITYTSGDALTHHALGDASLIPSSNGSVLVESPTGRGGVHVDVDGARADLYFRADPASRTPIFSTSLIGRTRSGERHPLVAFDHSRTADGRYTSTSRIDGFDVQNAAVEFRNQGQVLQRTPLSQIPLSSGGMMSSDWPTSFHYETETLEDGQSITVIAWDYEVESDSTAGGSSLSYDGNATVWPEGTDGAPLTVTHVALVLKSAALPADAIEGVSLTGASRLALLNGRSASSDR